ncbi:MAG: hypothetical protein KTR31_05990 [Myxococcales bacterium]|nr:hypothetical protein [Myxococcales bacterium]
MAQRRFGLFLLLWIPVCVLAFLVASDFFASWDGQAVSVRPATSDNPSSFSVLIAQESGDHIERTWPAKRVRDLGLPVDALAIPPADIPDTRPRTKKSAYAMHYLLQMPDEEWEVVPTTSPGSFGVGLLTLLIGIAVRNMVVAGSPFALSGSGLALPKAQAASGQPVQPGNRPRKGPPPGRRRKGSRRR